MNLSDHQVKQYYKYLDMRQKRDAVEATQFSGLVSILGKNDSTNIFPNSLEGSVSDDQTLSLQEESTKSITRRK